MKKNKQCGCSVIHLVKSKRPPWNWVCHSPTNVSRYHLPCVKTLPSCFTEGLWLSLKSYCFPLWLILAPLSALCAAGGLGRELFTHPLFDSLAIFVIMFDVTPQLK